MADAELRNDRRNHKDTEAPAQTDLSRGLSMKRRQERAVPAGNLK